MLGVPMGAWEGREELVVCQPALGQTGVLSYSHRDAPSFPGSILRVPVLSTISLPLCSLGSAPCPPGSCPALALCPLTTVISRHPLCWGWHCPAMLSCPSPSGWCWLSLPSVGRARPSAPAAHSTSVVFIGAKMLFPCQSITEIGSVCVIGERILMAQFSLWE